MEDLKFYPGMPDEYTLNELTKRINDVENAAVFSINGIPPDASGNVTVVGGGSVTIADNLTTNSSTSVLSAAQGVVLKSLVDGKAAATHLHAVSDVTGLQAALDSKQANLVSGTTIKTINGTSILGPGNLEVSGGSSFNLTARTATGAEDTIITGNLLTGLTGASIVQFTIGGTVYTAGSTARTITGYGDIAILADGTFTFDSVTNWSGQVPPVTFQAQSGTGEIRQTTLTITVTPVDDAPSAIGDSAVVQLNQSVTLYPLSNDIDVDGSVTQILTINGVTPVLNTPIQCTNCTATPVASNGVTITPASNFSGVLTVPYTIPGGGAANMTVDVAPSEIAMFSPASPADPSLYPWFYTMANWYGPANSATNPTNTNNGTSATASTYTEAQGRWEGDNQTSLTRAGYLFDNPTTLFNIYRATGDSRYLDIAADRCEQYYSHVVIDPTTGYGFLDIEALDLPVNDQLTYAQRIGDTKYNYCTPYLWYEQFVGYDAGMRAKAIACALSQLQFPQTYSTEQNFWTERHSYFAIRESLAAYHLTGKAIWLTRANAWVDMIESMCTATGAPIHLESQHEGGTAIDMASTWMAPMLAEARLQHYRTTGDARFLQWMRRYADWMQANGFRQGSAAPGLVPWYYWTANGGFTDNGETDDISHAYEMAHFMRMGKWARQQLGIDATVYDSTIASLDLTAQYAFSDKTRTAPESQIYSTYRISPIRMGNWWFVNSQSKIFAFTVPLPTPVEAPENTSVPTISGIAQQGLQATISPGTWTPVSGGQAPTLTYTMQRSTDGGTTWVTIAGAGGSGASHTYTYVLADVGNRVRVAVEGSNSRGSVTAYSTSVLVTAAGAPAWTQNLATTATVAATGNVTLTVAASGTGITYTWEKSTDGGTTWATVQATSSPNLALTAVPQTDSGARFRVTATNGSGSIVSNVLVLTVTTATKRVGVTPGGADNGSGCAVYYASLSAAEAGERANLVTADKILRIECDAFVDTTPVTFAAANWTVDATHYIEVVCRAGQGHGGLRGVGYRHSQTTGTAWNIVVGVPYTILDGIAVVNTSTASGAAGAVYFLSTADNAVFRNPVIVGGSVPVNAVRCDRSVRIENPVIIGFQNGVNNQNYATKVYVTNGTVVGQTLNSFYGPGGTESTLINCYGQATTAAFGTQVNANNFKNNCASADGTGSSGLTGIPYTNTTFTDVTAGVEVLSLATGSALLGAGTATGATTTNILGATRSSPPNIGAF